MDQAVTQAMTHVTNVGTTAVLKQRFVVHSAHITDLWESLHAALEQIRRCTAGHGQESRLLDLRKAPLQQQPVL